MLFSELVVREGIECLMQPTNITSAESDSTWFLRRGAPSNLMIDLFNWAPQHYLKMRIVMGLEQQPDVLIPLESDVLERIVEKWNSLKQCRLTDIGRVKLLAEEFSDISLSLIYSSILAVRGENGSGE